jgi:hypothetical protein
MLGTASPLEICDVGSPLSHNVNRFLGRAVKRPLDDTALEVAPEGASRKETQALTSATFVRVDARRNSLLRKDLADGEGFEPPLDSRPERFSRPPP